MIKFTIETPSLDKDAFECLFNNLELIRSNKKFILSKKKYRDIRINGIFAAGIYFYGGGDIPLGILLDLWDNTNWHTDNKFYFNIVGSPLSGMNHCGWFDTDTKRLMSGSVTRWNDLAPIAIHSIRQSKDYKDRNRQLQRWKDKNKRENCSFAEWSKKVDQGKIDKYTQQPKRTPTLTIYQLVELLNNNNLGLTEKSSSI